MAIIEIEDVTLPPSELEAHSANLFSQVNGSNQDRDLADLAAAMCQSQPANISGDFGEHQDNAGGQ